MKNQMKNMIKKYALLFYFVIACALSWTIEFPLIAVRQGWTDIQVPFSIHYLASFGPMLAALIMTALTSGKDGLRELWSRITRWRVKWVYAAFAVLSPMALFLI